MKFPSIHETCIIDGETISLRECTHAEPFCTFITGRSGLLTVGSRVTFYPRVTIRSSRGNIRIGNDVSFGPGVSIYEVSGGLIIGDNTLLAAGVTICGTTHTFDAIDMPIREQAKVAQEVSIGKNVWIGMNTVIHPGVSIGDNSIIGSNSMVNKSIPPWSVAYGTPCIVRRRRVSMSLED